MTVQVGKLEKLVSDLLLPQQAITDGVEAWARKWLQASAEHRQTKELREEGIKVLGDTVFRCIIWLNQMGWASQEAKTYSTKEAAPKMERMNAIIAALEIA